MKSIVIALGLINVFLIICILLVYWRYRHTEALALSLIAYMDANGRVPTYAELQPYVRATLMGRIDIK